MCYVKTTDGTSCLLLSFPYGSLIQCVEMVGGKVRWQVDKQQMRRSFVHFNICTDGSTVFVADPGPNVLHLLSVEDGSVLTSIGLLLLGIHLPGCVLAQGDHLYIRHANKNVDTYFVSKLIKPITIKTEPLDYCNKWCIFLD